MITIANVEFVGRCKKVVLVPRGENDPHICVEIWTEDDENWFLSSNMFSSSWNPELIELLTKAQKWMETQEPDMYEGRQYGWKFKPVEIK